MTKKEMLTEMLAKRHNENLSKEAQNSYMKFWMKMPTRVIAEEYREMMNKR